MRSRQIANGEMLAIEPGAIHRGEAGFFLMMQDETVASHRHGTYSDVAVVHIRGSLEQHSGGGGDNYEDILRRITDACSGCDACEEGAEPVPPSAVILCIDSRGGVVAGLAETSEAIKKIRQQTGIPLLAYVNERATSAGYHIACTADEIMSPASAIIGSIGTISTMISVTEQDKMQGIDVRLITSGARKADGHPHVPISDAAEEAERERVEELADAFYKFAGKARGISVDKLRGMQAAIFLGPQAVKRGLIDAIMSLDDLAMGASKMPARTGTAKAKGNETDRRMSSDAAHVTLDTSAQRGSSLTLPGTPQEAHMPVALDVLIKKAEAALAAATDPMKKTRIQADLAAYQLVKMRAEGSDDEDDDDDADDDDEDSKSKKAAKKAEEAKKAAEAAKHRAKAAEFRKKAEEAEEAAKKAEGEDEEAEDEAEDKKAAAAAGAAAAIAGSQEIAAATAKRVDALEKERDDARKNESITLAQQARRITPAEAKRLRTESTAFVRKFLEYRPHAIITSQDEVTLPADTPTGSEMLPAKTMKMINEAVASQIGAMGDVPADKRKEIENTLRTRLVESHRSRLAENGVAGKV